MEIFGSFCSYFSWHIHGDMRFSREWPPWYPSYFDITFWKKFQVNLLQPLQNSVLVPKIVFFVFFLVISQFWDLTEIWGFNMDDPYDSLKFFISLNNSFTKTNFTQAHHLVVFNSFLIIPQRWHLKIYNTSWLQYQTKPHTIFLKWWFLAAYGHILILGFVRVHSCQFHNTSWPIYLTKPHTTSLKWLFFGNCLVNKNPAIRSQILNTCSCH